MTMNAITITGYKPYELNIRDDKDEKILVIKEAIKRSLLRYLENGVEWVLLSGQPGVETWAFDLIQELKKHTPSIQPSFHHLWNKKKYGKSPFRKNITK